MAFFMPNFVGDHSSVNLPAKIKLKFWHNFIEKIQLGMTSLLLTKEYLSNIINNVDDASIIVNEYIQSLPLATTHIVIEYRNLSQLPDLSRFTHLQELRCGHNNLMEIPTLPYTLIRLYCSFNKLKHLPSLPPNLESLSCDNNEITHLPRLPNNLEILSCDNNEITYLPNLNNVKFLYCNNCKLNSLPEINNRLHALFCENNQISELPYLNNLRSIYCRNNKINNFPESRDLFKLFCDNNPIWETFSKHVYHNNMSYEARTLNKFRHLFYSLKFKGKFRRWFWIQKEKIAMEKYSPDNLEALLINVEDDSEEEFQEVLDTW